MSTYSGGGGRQRARSYVRVQDPAVGFFVAGSANEGINGLYARTTTVPESLQGSDRKFSLMYNHLDSGWNLGLGETGLGESSYEWVFIDPAGRDVLVNEENTLIPAAGEKWKVAHRPPPPKEDSSFFSRWKGKWGRAGEEDDGEEEVKEDEEAVKGDERKERRDARPPGTQVEATAGGGDGDDTDQLPWQMIAILGEDMLQNLAGHKRYHDSLVRNALNCRPPAPPPGASDELAPPPEAVTAAARSDADEAFERGRHADAAALYGEDIKALDFIAPEEEEDADDADTADEGAKKSRGAWIRALLGLRRAESLRRARQLDAARNQLEDVLSTHPLYLDAMFQVALNRLDGGDVQGATMGLRALLCADRAYPGLQEWLVRARAREKRAEAHETEREKDADRRKEEEQRLGVISRGATPHCLAWRQTGACDPEGGAREPEYDLPCHEPIPPGSSGWCECAAPTSLGHAVVAAGLYKYAREHPLKPRADPTAGMTIEQKIAYKFSDGGGGSGGGADDVVQDDKDLYKSHNVSRALSLTCEHRGGETCSRACGNAWRAELKRVTALTKQFERAAANSEEGAGEAAAAMRAALDAMKAWEKEQMYASRRRGGGGGGGGDDGDDDDAMVGGRDHFGRSTTADDNVDTTGMSLEDKILHMYGEGSGSRSGSSGSGGSRSSGSGGDSGSGSGNSGLGSDSLTPAGFGGDGGEDPTAGWSDHYAVLSLPADFTESELKASYRRLSLRMHPDKPGGSMAAFQRVAESYQVLSDAEQRRPYDLGAGLGEVDAEEGKETSLWDEVEQRLFPERYGFKPFGDPFERKRKMTERKANERQRAQQPPRDDRRSHDEF